MEKRLQGVCATNDCMQELRIAHVFKLCSVQASLDDREQDAEGDSQQAGASAEAAAEDGKRMPGDSPRSTTDTHSQHTEPQDNSACVGNAVDSRSADAGALQEAVAGAQVGQSRLFCLLPAR
jgi:hypothetical protein